MSDKEGFVVIENQETGERMRVPRSQVFEPEAMPTSSQEPSAPSTKTEATLSADNRNVVQKAGDSMFDPDSELGAFTRGATDSLTLGFKNELMGLGNTIDAAPLAFAKSLSSKDVKLLDELMKVYRRTRDSGAYADYQAAQAHPGAYRAGSLTPLGLALLRGGFAALRGGSRVARGKPFFKPPPPGAKDSKALLQAAFSKAAPVAKAAGMGAAGGLGASDADLTEGEVGEAAKDMAEGAAWGLGFHGAGAAGRRLIGGSKGATSRPAEPGREAAVASAEAKAADATIKSLRLPKGYADKLQARWEGNPRQKIEFARWLYDQGLLDTIAGESVKSKGGLFGALKPRGGRGGVRVPGLGTSLGAMQSRLAKDKPGLQQYYGEVLRALDEGVDINALPSYEDFVGRILIPTVQGRYGAPGGQFLKNPHIEHAKDVLLKGGKKKMSFADMEIQKKLLDDRYNIESVDARGQLTPRNELWDQMRRQAKTFTEKQVAKSASGSDAERLEKLLRFMSAKKQYGLHSQAEKAVRKGLHGEGASKLKAAFTADSIGDAVGDIASGNFASAAGKVMKPAFYDAWIRRGGSTMALRAWRAVETAKTAPWKFGKYAEKMARSANVSEDEAIKTHLALMSDPEYAAMVENMSLETAK